MEINALTDQIINLHKSSIQTNQDADEALSEAVKYSRDALERQRDEFALVKKAIQEQLFRDIERAGGQAQSLLAKLMTDLNAGVQKTLTRMASTAKKLENDLTGLYTVRDLFPCYKWSFY